MVLEVLNNFTDNNDCDVVLVTHDNVLFNAIQKTRLELNNEFDELSDILKEEAKRLSIDAKEGKLSLFLGAGVSMGSVILLL